MMYLMSKRFLTVCLFPALFSVLEFAMQVFQLCQSFYISSVSKVHMKLMCLTWLCTVTVIIIRYVYSTALSEMLPGQSSLTEREVFKCLLNRTSDIGKGLFGTEVACSSWTGPQ